MCQLRPALVGHNELRVAKAQGLVEMQRGGSSGLSPTLPVYAQSLVCARRLDSDEEGWALRDAFDGTLRGDLVGGTFNSVNRHVCLQDAKLFVHIILNKLFTARNGVGL
jgi:hypothetical protein